MANHRRFLSFLRKRVESEAVAEDILQAALARGLEKRGQLREDENIVAWFYRLLRNALVDHYRAREASTRATERASVERTEASSLDDGLHQEVCACMTGLIETLKPEYATALKDVDLGEKPVAAYAGAQGISGNNARVRLHRARKALHARLLEACGTCATHGCLDCTCSPHR